MQLYSLGYGTWNTKLRLGQLIQTLNDAAVNLLVDVRLSPCSSNLDPNSNYGPKDWNLMLGHAGLAYHLRNATIEYRWLVELGNPQKVDPEMGILRSHIATGSDQWPVNRGLLLLKDLVQEEQRRVCLLCACADYDSCHRKLIAETLRDRFFNGELEITTLR